MTVTVKIDRVWEGSPLECDFCHCINEKQYVDGKTKQGPWAIMCMTHHKRYGVGIGPGMGQHYEFNAADGKYHKIAG